MCDNAHVIFSASTEYALHSIARALSLCPNVTHTQEEEQSEGNGNEQFNNGGSDADQHDPNDLKVCVCFLIVAMKHYVGVNDVLRHARGLTRAANRHLIRDVSFDVILCRRSINHH